MSDKIRAALNTAIQTFIATFGLALLGFLAKVQEWADSGGDFPQVSVLSKAAISAVVALVAAVVSIAYNWAKDHNWLPGSSPTYAPPPAKPEG